MYRYIIPFFCAIVFCVPAMADNFSERFVSRGIDAKAFDAAWGNAGTINSTNRCAANQGDVQYISGACIGASKSRSPACTNS